MVLCRTLLTRKAKGKHSAGSNDETECMTNEGGTSASPFRTVRLSDNYQTKFTINVFVSPIAVQVTVTVPLFAFIVQDCPVAETLPFSVQETVLGDSFVSGNQLSLTSVPFAIDMTFVPFSFLL